MNMNGCVSVISGELHSRVSGLRQTGEREYCCTMDFDPAFRGFEGHFDGNPIAPGICLIQAARVIAEAILEKNLETRCVTNCRFRRPVLAGERASIKVRLETAGDALWKVQADIRVDGEVCSLIQLKAAEL